MNQDHDALAESYGQLNEEQLVQIFQSAVKTVKFDYLIWQNVTDYQFVAFNADFNPVNCTEAWAFGENGEIHWRQEICRKNGTWERSWRLVFIGEHGIRSLLPAEENYSPKTVDLTTCEPAASSVALWGNRKPDQPCWLEARIPRLLEYPANPEWEKVRMNVICYQQDGKTLLMRRTGISIY